MIRVGRSFTPDLIWRVNYCSSHGLDPIRKQDWEVATRAFEREMKRPADGGWKGREITIVFIDEVTE